MADGPPALILPIATGGEHTAHAIRRGADGFLYVLGGNASRFKKDELKGGCSSLAAPYAGLLLRLMSSGQAVALPHAGRPPRQHEP